MYSIYISSMFLNGCRFFCGHIVLQGCVVSATILHFRHVEVSKSLTEIASGDAPGNAG